MQLNRPFTMILQSKEMLHQAAQSFSQSIVVKLDSVLTIWISSKIRLLFQKNDKLNDLWTSSVTIQLLLILKL